MNLFLTLLVLLTWEISLISVGVTDTHHSEVSSCYLILQEKPYRSCEDRYPSTFSTFDQDQSMLFEVGVVWDYAAYFTIPICYSVFLLSVQKLSWFCIDRHCTENINLEFCCHFKSVFVLCKSTYRYSDFLLNVDIYLKKLKWALRQMSWILEALLRYPIDN